MLFQILKVLVGFYYKVFFRLKVTGRENIPKDEPFLLCANHLSLQDPILLTLVMGKKLRYMAKEELFKNKLLIFSKIWDLLSKMVQKLKLNTITLNL